MDRETDIFLSISHNYFLFHLGPFGAGASLQDTMLYYQSCLSDSCATQSFADDGHCESIAIFALYISGQGHDYGDWRAARTECGKKVMNRYMMW